jgi:bifunctional non-homologous end joining protein LigD
VLYAFDLLMLQGKDVRLWPLEERREQLQALVRNLPDAIRFSETFSVPVSELMRAVRKHQLEGIVAKRGRQPISIGRAVRRLAKVAG